MGRRDGRISKLNDALQHLPSPFADINTLKKNFADKGLNTKDLVVLSGINFYVQHLIYDLKELSI